MVVQCPLPKALPSYTAWELFTALIQEGVKKKTSIIGGGGGEWAGGAVVWVGRGLRNYFEMLYF